MIRRALRVTVPPLTIIFVMDLGMLLGGAILAEEVFSLHGSAPWPLT